MDERLLKKSVQSIEMPEDMKERIIKNCRSGEAKPLFTPKKRAVYMPMAVTACACVLAAALAGVGVWQLRVLRGTPNPIINDIGADDIINVIPIYDEDLDTMTDAYKDGYGPDNSGYDDFVRLTDRERNEYYGIDPDALLSELGLKRYVTDGTLYDGDTASRLFKAEGGTGEVYFDTNVYNYGEDERTGIYISKLGIPCSFPKLWSDSEKLSTISGVTAAVGVREGEDWQPGDRYRYRVEFKLEQYGLYFNIWCDYGMISKAVYAVKNHCEQKLSTDEPVPAGDEINVIPLEPDDIPADVYDLDEADKVYLSDGQLLEYFGTDVSVLGRLTAIPDDMRYMPYGWEADPCFYVKGGEAGDIFRDTYCDHWTAVYNNAAEDDYAPVNLRNIAVTVSVLGTPQYIEKLWEDPHKLSRIHGYPAAVGCLSEYDTNTYIAQLQIGAIRISVKGYRVELEELCEFTAQVMDFCDFFRDGSPSDMICVIPITQDDISEAWDRDAPDADVSGDMVVMNDKQLSEYYGLDITRFPGIPGDLTPMEFHMDRGVYRNSSGDIYMDYNGFNYANEKPDSDRAMYITVGKVYPIPFTIEKLWQDEAMLSRINGVRVAIGRTDDGLINAEFMIGGTGFNVQCRGIGIDELREFISAVAGMGRGQTREKLTLDRLREICSGDCSSLSWKDFEQFDSMDIGSGLYIYQYDIEGRYILLIGGVPEVEPYYMIFSTLIGEEQGIDIREGGLEDYLDLHAGTAMTHTPLTLEKLLEICSGDCSGLSWKDFEQYVCTERGGALYRRVYIIDGKYFLQIDGEDALSEPYSMDFCVIGRDGGIDIRKDSIEEYLGNTPVPEGNVINVIPMGPEPITPEDFRRSEADFVEMTAEELNEYFGTNVFPKTPDDMYWWNEPPITNAIGVCRSEGGTGEVYLDYNGLVYKGDYGPGWDRGMCVYFMKGRIPGQLKELLWSDPAELSVINGVTAAIGIDDDGRYYTEFMLGDVGFHLQGSINGGLSLEEWTDIVSSLIPQ